LGALVVLLRFEEIAGLGFGREAADDVEVATAEEGGIIDDGIRFDVLSLLAFDEDFIEFARRIEDDVEGEGFGEGGGTDEKEREEMFHGDVN